MNPNNLVLFDIDGTLTEARKSVTKNVLIALRELSRYVEIGFVTGSNMEYLKEQLWPLLADPLIRQNCHLLPCNGTQYIIPYGDEEIFFNTLSAAFMEEEIGPQQFNKLMQYLCVLQGELVQEIKDLPLTGNFIQNRDSMINWCPIGRNAVQRQRNTFKSLDSLYSIRQRYIKKIKKFALEQDIGVTIKLGGNTSFDIFPTGWDKTYVFNHFDKNEWIFWFVGDRCSIDGNDFEIFSALKSSGRAFETSGPEETVEIIDYYIMPEL